MVSFWMRVLLHKGYIFRLDRKIILTYVKIAMRWFATPPEWKFYFPTYQHLLVVDTGVCFVTAVVSTETRLVLVVVE